MPASWVGASVRARLLANRRLGRGRIAGVVQSGSLDEAIAALADSPYGAGITAGMTAAQAQRQVAATVLWNLRLVAGWLPPGGSQVLQPLAAWFEIANIEERLAYLETGGRPSPYQLGHLAVAWGAVSAATTAEGVRAELARSPWGDPRTSDPTGILLHLRFRWAAWVAEAVPQAAAWAAAGSTLLAARLLFAGRRPNLPDAARHAYGLPPGWRDASSVSELRGMMPRQTAWVLGGVNATADLWRSEATWWSRVRRDSVEALVGSRFDSAVVVAAVAMLAYDAWLARAALGAVARGASARRVFDAVA
jgi:hypothetical protein